MVTCCKACQDRAINCHSTCGRYLHAVEQHRIEQEQKRKFNEGHVAVTEYKRNRYKAVDKQNYVRELKGRKKW